MRRTLIFLSVFYPVFALATTKSYEVRVKAGAQARTLVSTETSCRLDRKAIPQKVCTEIATQFEAVITNEAPHEFSDGQRRTAILEIDSHSKTISRRVAIDQRETCAIEEDECRVEPVSLAAQLALKVLALKVP